MLTKTNYIIWRDCAKNAWIKVHKPDLYYAEELSDFEKQIIETGNEVELVARELFPTGKLIETRNEEALEDTQKLLENGEKTLFQATFSEGGFYAAVDVLKVDGDECEIYEIKATNSIDKKTHYHDLTFQVNLLEMRGFNVKKASIIHLNPDYIREGDLEITKLFSIEDVTETVEGMKEEVKDEMNLALKYVSQNKEPTGPCDCIYKGRSSHCTTFKYSNPHVPEYGVHDLSRIGLSKRKLTELIDSNIFNFEDIPESIDLSDTQKNQIIAHLQDRTIISTEDIREEFESLAFPLYFLDYETFPSALPRYDGYSPYTQIPFQYSLHILDEPEGEPRHEEFIHTEDSDPSEKFYESLRSHIGDTGSIVVWHKGFELGRNRELIQRIPDSKNFFLDMEKRVYDLEDIFKKQLYVHKDFMGKSSIKYILPVMVPELSYKDLGIQNGGMAAEAWNKITNRSTSTKEKTALTDDLLKYCKLDTYAMYAIWKKLKELIN